MTSKRSFARIALEIIVVLLWPLLALLIHNRSDIIDWFSGIADSINESADMEKYGLSWEEFLPLERLAFSDEFFTKILYSSRSKSSQIAFETKTNCQDNFGTSYGYAITGKGTNYYDSYDTEAWREYELDGSYREIRGRVVLNGSSSYSSYDGKSYRKAEVCLKIFGDGVLLYESQTVTGGSEPQDFTVDISHVSILKVHIQNCWILRLVDCGLYRDSSVPTVSTATAPEIFEQPQAYLYELFEFNRSLTNNGIAWWTETTDSRGTDYSTPAIALYSHKTDTQDELWSDFRINGRYSRIKGKVVLNGSGRNQADGQYFSIYGDGMLLYRSQPLTPEYVPEDFNIDISGVTTLRIAMNDPSADVLRVVDCILYKDP